MSVTLDEFVDICEQDLNDSGNATWAAADLKQWSIDSIADYGLHFPLKLTDDITTSLNVRIYDIDEGFLTAVSVEYPQGEDPPQYLQPRSHVHSNFWTTEGYYDIILRDDDQVKNEILISTKPAASETIRVNYLSHHILPSAGATKLTVPDEHQHILRNYVLWRAAIQLKVAEEASPTSNSSLIMSQLAVNVDRMRRAYVDSLAKALYAVSRSRPVSWKGQSNESSRIY